MSDNTIIWDGVAGQDLSASQYKVLYRDGGDTEKLKIVASATRTDIAGICLSNALGDDGTVRFAVQGPVRTVAGGAIEPGDKVSADASGDVIKAAAGATVIGEYLCLGSGEVADAADGDEITILLYADKNQRLNMSATLTHDFGSIADGARGSQTVTVTGAATGDHVLVTAPSLEAGGIATGYVSAADTVTVLVSNFSGGALDPASQDFIVLVIPA